MVRIFGNRRLVKLQGSLFNFKAYCHHLNFTIQKQERKISSKKEKLKKKKQNLRMMSMSFIGLCIARFGYKILHHSRCYYDQNKGEVVVV